MLKKKDGDFMVVATDTMHRHVETWMSMLMFYQERSRSSVFGGRVQYINSQLMSTERHAESYQNVIISDVTGGVAQLNIQGPKSRALLEKVTGLDMYEIMRIWGREWAWML